MTDSKKRKIAYFMLIFSSIFLYVTLTGAKQLYTAEKTTLYATGIFGNLTDLASTMEYYFYTYAAMQIFLVFFVKKINIKWFLTATLGISAVLIALVPLTTGITQHYVLFSVNGVLQAGIWGCMLKVLSKHLPSRLLPTANQIMSAGPAIAGALSYVVAAAFGEDWKTPFLVMGIVVFLSVVLYCVSVSAMERFPREIETHHVVRSDGTEAEVADDDDNDFIHLVTKRRVIVFYAVSIILGFLLTSIYFAMSNNLDVYLKEIGGFSNGKAKLLTIFAPIFAVLGPFACVWLCEKQKNFIAVCALFYGAAMLLSLINLFTFEKSPAASLVLLVLFIVLVNGGRSVTLSIVSLRMRSKIDTGVYSTAVNAACSLASGIAPKVITRVLDNGEYSTAKSWQVSFMILFIATLAVVALLLLTMLAVRLANKNKNFD